MQKSRRLRAFSLIELSIVIVIIGILIAGVIQGNKIYRKAQLAIAQNLTRNSPVNGIKDLMLWYETSLESSFNSNEGVNGGSISAWYDNSPQSPLKNNSTQTTSNAKPTFTDNAFPQGIPSVRFDGSSDYLSMGDVSPLVGSYYTIFIVEQKRVAFSSQTFILNIGTGAFTGCCIIAGYNSDTAVILDKWNGGVTYTNSTLAYSNPTPRIHTFLQSSTGAKYWLNGGNTTDSTSGSTYTLAATGTPYIAKFTCCTFYNGDLGEIIIYTRALTTEERQAIETYLGQKYSLTIS